MLRVGLTGGLGSGKSTVGAMLAKRGAYLLQADEIARDLMRPGQPVYDAILRSFGPDVAQANGDLDRGELARLAFVEGRVEELNAIVHPAVIAKQAEIAAKIGEQSPDAVVVVESALIFETQHGEGWRQRFDRLVLVTAQDQTKVDRYVRRATESPAPGPTDIADLEAEARRRLSLQVSDAQKSARCDYVLTNNDSLEGLEQQVAALWANLRRDAVSRRPFEVPV